MSIMLTCPVCERSQIETNTCPNCETDLSTYRMLAELPVATEVETKQKAIPIWLPLGIALLLLLLGMGLGVAGNSVVARQKPQITPVDVVITPIKLEEPTEPVAKAIATEVETRSSCSGFNYVVERGDSLSLLATDFYHDSNYWSLISQANPTIQGRENSIEIGETLLVPNKEWNCG